MRINRRSLRSLTLAVFLTGASMFAQASTSMAVPSSTLGSYSFFDALNVKIADLTIAIEQKKNGKSTFSYTFDEATAGYLGDATSLTISYLNNGGNQVAQNIGLSSSADNISGTFNGAGSTFWSASLTYTAAAAVPEPETYAMLLAGLGLMGFVARRRRQA